jgi:ABC-type lipoprotein release transport system permease subunit
MLGAIEVMPALNDATGGRFPPLFIEAETFVWAGVIALALAVAVALPPALRVRRLRIVEALAGHR